MTETKQTPATRGRFHWVKRLGCGLTVATGVVGVVGAVVLGFLYYQNVIVDPGPHLDAKHVRSIIAQESPVYYRDGETRIGVFFEDEHRQYVAYEQLPLAWQMGIVAAEDGGYWSHSGVNTKGLVRAMRDNILAGSVVAGGSTLSQQTAKNLYYRPDRSLKSKGTELVNALRLEAHFDKRQILTFYANQFHVSGNGRGLGIGARYFFDKAPEELTIPEAAFLAGLVKAPSRYDPFIGDEARRAKSKDRANTRVRYVLGRIVDEPLDHLVPPAAEGETPEAYRLRRHQAEQVKERAALLLDEGFELPFKRGTFRYASNAVLDEVGRRLREAPFDEVLENAGIDDPATAGLKVVTTLDADAQREAIYGLWHHLTEVGTWMEKRTVEDFKVTDRVRFDPDREPVRHTFRSGKVTRLISEPSKHFEVDLGGISCLVDRGALVRVAVASKRGVAGNKSLRGKTAEIDAFVDSFAVDDRVWTSIREVDGDKRICDLEVRPELQGAVIVLEDGEVRAMVGGNDNRNFNRTTALRQMGSTWKPLVFHAAMELGWSPGDAVDNRRNVFPFSTTFYYPRPDHDPAPEVSMSWAGVRSENLASVWLLYHLTDKLSSKQVSALAETLDLAKREDEDAKAYATRIQKLGVLPTPARRAESHFLQAKSELLASGLREPSDRLAVQSLYYGWGFDRETGRVTRAGGRGRSTKLAALNNRWTHLKGRLGPCKAQHQLLDSAWRRGELPTAAVVADLSVMVSDEGLEVACGAVPEGFGPVEATLKDLLSGDADQVAPPAEEVLDEQPKPRNTLKRLEALLKPLGVKNLGRALPEVEPFASIQIEERFHAGTLIELDAALSRRELTRQLAAGDLPGLYEPEVLYWQQDFRVLMAMRYLQSMARTYGVASELNTVLSLPLGANEITLEEVASVYQGITTGQAWSFPGAGSGATFEAVPTATLLIAEIRDVDDNVLYRAKGVSKQIAPKEAGDMTADILRNVVLHGTGRRAKTSVAERDVPVPLGGKTGTTNDFKNAAFAGFAPHADGAGYSMEEGFTVAAYVGYDDNRPMKNGRIRLAGASGALPAWILTIDGMREAGLLGRPSEGAESVGGAWSLQTNSNLVRVPTGEDGLVASGQVYATGTPSVLVPLPTVAEKPVVRFKLSGRPIRLAPRTDQVRKPVTLRDLWGRKRKKGNR